MKIIDGFTFYNELEMLKYRLTLLYPIIDYFILVEATKTYANNSKELYYEKNKDTFKEFQDKIIHIIVDDMPNSQNAWDLETHQRRCISRGFSKIQMNDDDIIIISDLDEIPNPETILKLKDTGLTTLSSLKQHLYYYNFNTYLQDSWLHAVVLTYNQLITKYNGDTNFVRGKGNNTIIENGGWHLSYFGSAEFISNKIKNFSHQEFNTEHYTNIPLIQTRLQSGRDLFERNDVTIKYISIEENPNLPPNHAMILDLMKRV